MKYLKQPRFAATALALALSPMALAQPMLEEVIVTAQKRAESLQDVPISVSAMSGEKITNTGITDLQELTLYIPNVNINQGQAQPNLFIRGVGSGTNAGFEQSVGMYIDGVYSGRGALAAVPLTMDLERVEVLKGPQGILFGKNTIGGAINITTAKPSFDFEGMVDALYSDDDGEQQYNLMLNGGITDKLAGRLAVRHDAMDGWWDNKELNTEGPDRDNWYARGSLLFDASDSLEVIAKYEYGDFQIDGQPLVVYQSDQPQNFLGQDVFPIIDDEDKAAFDLDDSADVRTDVGALTLNWDIEFATMTSISAYSGYERKTVTNTDFAVTPALHRTLDEDFDQWSQEIRLVSPGGETLDWIVGGYYEYSELEVSRVTAPTDFALAGPLAVSPLVALGEPPVPSQFDQDTEAFAIFAQLTYSITDRVRITGGLRYNDESKDLDKRFTSQVGARASDTGPAANLIVRGRPRDNAIISDLRSHNWQGLDRDKDKWTWSFNTQWDATDEAMLYASVSTGFKSGGFDEAYSGAGDIVRLTDNIITGEPNGQTIPGEDSSILEYDDETVLAYEVGAKMGLLDGAAELNIAVFRSEYDDLQTSALVGDVFRVGNAGEAITQGVEIDGRWAITERLTFGGSIAYLDATYDDFKGGPCTIPQGSFPLDNPGCIGPDGENLTEPLTPFNPGAQDLTDEDLLFSPEWSSNLNVEYIYPFDNGLELITSVDMNYSDEFFSAQDQDPNTKHDSYTKWNARIALSGDNDTWSVAIIGKNLTDETTWAWRNDVALTASNSYFAVTERPRSIALQARYRF
jgi:outer membrane receptor protein involved in Fe transport